MIDNITTNRNRMQFYIGFKCTYNHEEQDKCRIKRENRKTLDHNQTFNMFFEVGDHTHIGRELGLFLAGYENNYVVDLGDPSKNL